MGCLWLHSVCNGSQQVNNRNEDNFLLFYTDYRINITLHATTLGINYVFEMIDVWDAVYTFINHRRLFLATEIRFEQRVGNS